MTILVHGLKTDDDWSWPISFRMTSSLLYTL